MHSSFRILWLLRDACAVCRLIVSLLSHLRACNHNLTIDRRFAFYNKYAFLRLLFTYNFCNQCMVIGTRLQWRARCTHRESTSLNTTWRGVAEKALEVQKHAISEYKLRTLVAHLWRTLMLSASCSFLVLVGILYKMCSEILKPKYDLLWKMWCSLDECCTIDPLHWRWLYDSVVIRSSVALFSTSHCKNKAVAAWPQQQLLSTARCNGWATVTSQCTCMRRRQILRVATRARSNISASVLSVWFLSMHFC